MNIEKQTSNEKGDVWDVFAGKRNKVKILFEALDIMQHYNGQSIKQAVASAMGIEYEN